MSSIQHYSLMMQVVVQTTDEAIGNQVRKELLALAPELSFSPWREQDSLNACLECMATGTVTEEERELLLKTLDNDWDQDEKDDLYWAYGFNTKMFDPNVYYLQLEFQKLKPKA